MRHWAWVNWYNQLPVVYQIVFILERIQIHTLTNLDFDSFFVTVYIGAKRL